MGFFKDLKKSFTEGFKKGFEESYNNAQQIVESKVQQQSVQQEVYQEPIQPQPIQQQTVKLERKYPVCVYCYKELSPSTDSFCFHGPNQKHVQYVGPESNNGSYLCKYCGCEFKIGRNVYYDCVNSPTKQHVIYNGKRPNEYECMYCGYKHSNLKELTHHVCGNASHTFCVPKEY